MPVDAVRPAGAVAAWPMTVQAAAALASEIRSAEDELAALRDGRAGMATSARLVAAVLARLGALRAVLGYAVITDAPDVVVIGRQVTVDADDGETTRFRIVLPADGDPDRGWLGADSPLGLALLGRRAGDRILVPAPAGPWGARVVDVA